MNSPHSKMKYNGAAEPYEFFSPLQSFLPFDFFAVYQKKTFKNYISARSKISSLMSDIVINTWNIKLWTK